MVITSYHIQNVLRTYSQQISEGSRLARSRKPERAEQNDFVKISSEARKRHMVDTISQEMLTHLTQTSVRNGTAQEILNRLSQEYGKPLEVDLKENENLVFKVMDQVGKEVVDTLSPRDNEQLKNRLMDITKTIVSNNLL
jgi:signal recognition particle GTPase